MTLRGETNFLQSDCTFRPLHPQQVVSNFSIGIYPFYIIHSLRICTYYWWWPNLIQLVSLYSHFIFYPNDRPDPVGRLHL